MTLTQWGPLCNFVSIVDHIVTFSEHARRGLTGAVGGILRQVPSNLVRPVILATTATSNVLEGVKCHVAPESRREEEDKWKQTEA